MQTYANKALTNMVLRQLYSLYGAGEREQINQTHAYVYI